MEMPTRAQGEEDVVAAAADDVAVTAVVVLGKVVFVVVDAVTVQRPLLLGDDGVAVAV